MNENEKAFAFYAYTLGLVSTGLSPQEATIRARAGFDAESVVDEIRSRIGNEPVYGEMIASINPTPFYSSLLELLVTDPSQNPTIARNMRVRYVLTVAVIEGRLQSEEIKKHDELFKEGVERNGEREKLWSRADPENTIQRLKRMYIERQAKQFCQMITSPGD